MAAGGLDAERISDRESTICGASRWFRGVSDFIRVCVWARFSLNVRVRVYGGNLFQTAIKAAIDKWEEKNGDDPAEALKVWPYKSINHQYLCQ